MQVLHRVWLTLFHGDHFNYRALILSASAVVLAVVLRKVVQRYRIAADRHAFGADHHRPDRLSRGMVDSRNRTATPRCRWPPRSRGACPARTSPRCTPSGCRICPRVRWPSRSSALSRRCRSPKPSPTRPSRSSITTGRSWPKAWPTSPAGSSRASRARARYRDRRSTFSPARRHDSPGSSRPQRSPRRCYCSRPCCSTFRSRRWPGCCS